MITIGYYWLLTVTSSGGTFTGNRLKIWFGGRCIDADDDHKELKVAHCNPDLVGVGQGAMFQGWV